jgi:hypothetical protein
MNRASTSTEYLLLRALLTTASGALPRAGEAIELAVIVVLAASPDQPRFPAPNHVSDPSLLLLAAIWARSVLVAPRFGGV